MRSKVENHSLPSLFSRLQPLLVRAVQRIVGCRHTAEDLTQEAFLRVMGRDEHNAGYLFRTAQNLAFDHLRAQKVRQRYADSQQLHEEDDAIAGPEASAVTDELLARYLVALQALSERTQQVFLLSRLEGMTYQQIAKHLGVSVSTVEKDMMRALKICASCQSD